MGRNVEMETPEDAGWYVPDIEGNHEDWEDDPATAFKVRIAPASGQEISRIEEDMLSKLGGATSAKRAMRSSLRRGVQAQHRILEKYVIEVVNYSLRGKSGRLHVPKNGAELVAAVLDGPASEQAVLDDIMEAIRDVSKLRTGLEKKLVSQRASSSPEIGAGNGAAASAKAPGAATETSSATRGIASA